MRAFQMIFKMKLIPIFLPCLLVMLANASDTISDLRNRNLKVIDFDSEVLKKLSPDTLYLNLQGNELRSIHSSIPLYFPQLEKVILSDNPRLSFPSNGNPFLRSSSLIELLCEFCGIQIIYTHSLRRLPRMEYLKLNQNHIHQIAPYAFRRNRYLQSLDLSSNGLSTVPSVMLKGLLRIKYLDLSNNKDLAAKNDAPFLISGALEVLKCVNCGFTKTYEDTFTALTNLRELHLEGNLLLTMIYLPEPSVLVIRQGSELSSRICVDQYGQPIYVKQNHFIWWRNTTKFFF